MTRCVLSEYSIFNYGGDVMFGKRPDGREIKSLAPMEKIIPYIMKERHDAMNMYEEYFDCAPLDAYIKEKREEGIKITYMHIMIAAVVRLMALRPQLNRFIMRGKIYARPKIWVSFTLHHSLRDGDIESTIKVCFEGTESLPEIAKKMDEAIEKETVEWKGAQETENGTDKLIKLLAHLPGFVFRWAVNLLMWMDKHNIMPKAIIELSPFHTSFFITNLKSLGINHIFHHVYDFGTTGIFVAMGKERTVPVYNGDEVVKQKQMGFGLVSDERFCDGLYLSRSLRQMRKLMKNPALMDTPLEKKVEDAP